METWRVMANTECIFSRSFVKGKEWGNNQDSFVLLSFKKQLRVLFIGSFKRFDFPWVIQAWSYFHDSLHTACKFGQLTRWAVPLSAIHCVGQMDIRNNRTLWSKQHWCLSSEIFRATSSGQFTCRGVKIHITPNELQNSSHPTRAKYHCSSINREA